MFVHSSDRHGRYIISRAWSKNNFWARDIMIYLPLKLYPYMRRIQIKIESVESKTRTYHGRVRAGRRTAGRRGAAGPDRTELDGTVRPGDNHPLCPPELPAHRRQLSWTSLRKHEQTNYYGNRWRNKTHGWPAVSPRDDGRSSFLAADQRTDAYLSL